MHLPQVCVVLILGRRLFKSSIEKCGAFLRTALNRSNTVFSSICENFLFVEVSCEYVMVTWFKEIYRANTIILFIYFVGSTQALLLDTTYHERSP